MNNLFVFVEGEYDIMFIKNILYNYILKTQSINLIPITYQKKTNITTIKHIKQIETSGEKYIFLSDLDSHSYNCITDRKKKRILEFHQKDYEDIDPNKIVIVIEEIESWYIAGINTSLDPFKTLKIPNNTESFTKEQFDEMIKNSEFTSKIDIIMEISNNYDFSLAMNRNKSFKYLINKINNNASV